MRTNIWECSGISCFIMNFRSGALLAHYLILILSNSYIGYQIILQAVRVSVETSSWDIIISRSPRTSKIYLILKRIRDDRVSLHLHVSFSIKSEKTSVRHSSVQSDPYVDLYAIFSKSVSKIFLK